MIYGKSLPCVATSFDSSQSLYVNVPLPFLNSSICNICVSEPSGNTGHCFPLYTRTPLVGSFLTRCHVAGAQLHVSSFPLPLAKTHSTWLHTGVGVLLHRTALGSAPGQEHGTVCSIPESFRNRPLAHPITGIDCDRCTGLRRLGRRC